MARMRSSLVAATATIAALAAPTTASAVTTDCDGMQAALNNPANAVVTLAEGEECFRHYDLPQREIILEGGGASGATLNGQSKGSFQILSGDDVGATTIRNLTFRDGEADGEFDYERSGGAISLTGSSPVTLEGNRFYSNEASADGGAVSILEFRNIIDVEQDAAIETRGDGPSIVMRRNIFGGPDEGNDADDEGGAVYIDTFRDVQLDANRFEENVADQDDGGGLEIEQSADATLTGNTFLRNETADNGGGAGIESCTATITGNTFDRNESIGGGETSPDGAGLYLDGSGCESEVLLRGAPAVAVFQSGNRFIENVIDGNGDSGDGGGEYISDTTVESTNDRFVRNRIEDFEGRGGGLYVDGSNSGGKPFVARNLVADTNVILVPQPGLARGEIDGDTHGGGLFLTGDGTEFRIENSTIVGNSAGDGSGIAGEFSGGGEQITSDKLVLHNSIVRLNTGASDFAQFAFDGEISGFLTRDVQSSDVCDAEKDPLPGAGNICADPKFVPDDADQDVGEVDQTADSPTVDAGNSDLVDPDLTKDYSVAGDARVLNGRVDIGADEFKPAAVTPQTPAQPAPAVAPAAGGVLGTQQRSCRSRRAFRIRIRVPRGEKAVSATVRVNNRKVKVVRGKRLRAPVRLRGLPKGRFAVRITVRLADGTKLSGVRRYRTCIPKRPGDGPPKL